MNHNKLNAFTIMEVTIAMMVSAILILIVYTAFSVVSSSYHSFLFKNEESAGLVQLDRLLQRDFRRADMIIKNDSGILLKNNKSSVSYILNNNYIVRVSGITDTFKVKTESTHMTFEQQPVSMVTQDPVSNRIDELELDLLSHNEKITFHYFKLYSSADLFKQNANADN